MVSAPDAPPGRLEIADLRAATYNATLIRRIDIHEDLALFRVRPDGPIPPFQPGQYMALGLGYWEGRAQPSQAEQLQPKKLRKVVRRAYSISCPMLTDDGRLARCRDLDFLEFYIVLVRSADKPPALTPRLFALEEGDRLVAEPRIVGKYTLDGIEPDDAVMFFGTGTGEAPHNAMAAELLHGGHRGPVVVATGVRMQRDLAYAATHAEIARRYGNYRYIPYTTREPRNLDRTRRDYVGKEHLQAMVESGRFEEDARLALDPRRTHVFLCGNPAMIGYHPPGTPPPSRPGMLQILEERGFHVHEPVGPGLIRFEKYW